MVVKLETIDGQQQISLKRARTAFYNPESVAARAREIMENDQNLPVKGGLKEIYIDSVCALIRGETILVDPRLDPNGVLGKARRHTLNSQLTSLRSKLSQPVEYFSSRRR